ncbi:tRNA dimethylallyltransferase-like [Sycon ciliatum]|uniref:tRNA dimethylallyltransferase-like n=1 Tax=Sycon ciliatum TaxID=27933 RepID=UPI0031F634B8
MASEKWRDTVIVAVLGSTGTGKSKLGIELAQELNGEIISADSIQVYKGLDICSAKVTAEEQAAAQHHLLSVAECTHSYDVVKFRDTALSTISDILDRGKVPIIVGGTNYYIESLIWETLMPESSAVDQEMKVETNASSTPGGGCTVDDETHRHHPQADVDGTPVKTTEAAAAAAHASMVSPHERLQKVDPDMAARLHPNNIRKIERSLAVFEEHGIPHTQLLAQQHSDGDGACPQGARLRFPKTVAFWIRCDTDVLDKRLSKRVDGMVESGMMQELQCFHSEYGQHCLDETGRPSFESGLFQSIGYKELYPYLSRSPDMDEEKSKSLLTECLQSLVAATSRYARKQNAWIRNRFLKAGQKVRLYGVDSSHPENWNDDVLQPALSIVQALLTDSPAPLAPLPLQAATKNSWTKYECTACNRLLHGDQEWKAHLTSRMHRRRKKRTEKRRVKEST